ncbi:hypothetical protein [Kordia sp.]|uniref:hypothetical protein n=1 Tax=Kordia sp. TaxID=1965332 RepID=UPI003D6C4679
MIYYDTHQRKSEEGVFIKYNNGYYTFQFSFEERIIFEQIERNVLEDYNLRNDEYIGATFNITYEEIINDIDDEDFIIFKILELELIEK